MIELSENQVREIPSLIRLARLYTFHFPIDKGKGRLIRFAKGFYRELPASVVDETKDGRKIEVGFRDWAEDSIYFLGRYESFCTEVMTQHIRPGDICLDVGANIGWYTTLFRKCVGARGEVHSFEPVPEIFSRLKRNVALNNSPENVFLNNFALGENEGSAEIHIFDDLPFGHASIVAHKNKESKLIPIKIKTLDSYIEERATEAVNFVKVDIEGAELMFLKGARKLLRQKRPPIIFMEMALATSREFGHLPNDLINFISIEAAYDFFALDEIENRLLPIDGFADEEIGANVLCLPKN